MIPKLRKQECPYCKHPVKRMPEFLQVFSPFPSFACPTCRRQFYEVSQAMLLTQVSPPVEKKEPPLTSEEKFLMLLLVLIVVCFALYKLIPYILA